MIPSWLLRENHGPYEETRFDRALKEYKERFGKLDFNTESSYLSFDEWAEALEYCIEVGKPASEELPPEAIGVYTE